MEAKQYAVLGEQACPLSLEYELLLPLRRYKNDRY